jgi:acetyl-CoA carboxylase biotin carboxyl carrier protein
VRIIEEPTLSSFYNFTILSVNTKYSETIIVTAYHYIKGEKSMNQLIASMAGNVYKVLVKDGDIVSEGEDVVILESMKMEIPISAESEITVKAVMVAEGDFVNEGDVILEVE